MNDTGNLPSKPRDYKSTSPKPLLVKLQSLPSRLKQWFGVASSGANQGWSGLGLPSKLLVLTLVFVMLAEVLIFLPSIANFRVNWLTERLTSARLAALAAEAAKPNIVPKMVKQELLDTAQVRAVAIKKNRIRKLVLPPNSPVVVDANFDFREMSNDSTWSWISRRISLIGDALEVFTAPENRVIRVYGQASTGLGKPPAMDEFVEIVLPEKPLREAMLKFARNILILSIIISIIAASLVYFALIRVLVQPMMDISKNMLQFSENPEDPGRVIVPSGRGDELGTAERELANMQNEMIGLLQQKNRLAQLGLAVSKINHDLRNMLASAQLISDRLATLQDPSVQRFAPKLIASLDRAINFCNDTLKFGKAQEAAPRREVFSIKALIDEVADGLDLPRDGVDWQVDIDPAVQIDADREHLYRVLNNICRNSAQALDAQSEGLEGCIKVGAKRESLRTVIEISDNGPGVPPKAREHLFQAFQGAVRKGGTGLGLAVSAELIQAHGGRIELIDSATGAAFRIEVPDRGTY
ncbi:MAG: HAMP domain-containing sensor histidine kinase [Pseudomonadota bacterium]